MTGTAVDGWDIVEIWKGLAGKGDGESWVVVKSSAGRIMCGSRAAMKNLYKNNPATRPVDRSDIGWLGR